MDHQSPHCVSQTQAMDPISITASFVGILSTAAKLCSLLTTFMSGVNSAPKAAERVLKEVFQITTYLTQLQEYLLTPRVGSRSRKALIMVQEVQVALANTVIIFSELEEMVVLVRSDKPMGPLTRIRWALRENALDKILHRLQRAKTSLNLILTTLTWSALVEEAELGK